MDPFQVETAWEGQPLTREVAENLIVEKKRNLALVFPPDFSKVLEQCQAGPVIVTKNGRPVAVLVSILEDDELERFVLAHTPRFRHLLDDAEQRIQKTGGVKHQDFWRVVDGAT
ncbi:hypothetical protein HKBW3S43_01456 [Candidatus Hakubella thermalkaliphila]|uniref:Antitoxin n=1 Tax=Candidatus Hakubella thermalkaliphila TaxID=2754717 RepID=A0A6V8PTQ2_9ACTN|nr:type II toxin-antitoxin system Phd/YefM family antitoxin [Candidatus Hakubella thermalkaliphila]GFP35667.1 hypothetical protein HKBW3S43_01456 [Candidatus Hakubella thermalkaliphila]